jgi:hypothetical protein
MTDLTAAFNGQVQRRLEHEFNLWLMFALIVDIDAERRKQAHLLQARRRTPFVIR